MKTKILIVLIALITPLAWAEEDSAFHKFQAFLEGRTFNARDHTTSEKVTVAKEGDSVRFRQTLVSEGTLGSATAQLTWIVAVSDLLAAHVERQDFANGTLKISVASDLPAGAFRFEGATSFMEAAGGRSKSKPNSGRALRFGILFNDSKEADEFLALYAGFIEDLKTKKG
jgi:hypothetical protein